MNACLYCKGEGTIEVGEGPYYAPMGEEGGQFIQVVKCEDCQGTGEVGFAWKCWKCGSDNPSTEKYCACEYDSFSFD